MQSRKAHVRIPFELDLSFATELDRAVREANAQREAPLSRTAWITEACIEKMKRQRQARCEQPAPGTSCACAAA